MATQVTVSELPDCDVCAMLGYRPVRKAAYDFRTRMGSWANGCTTHYREYRMHRELGTGKGQKLVKA